MRAEWSMRSVMRVSIIVASFFGLWLMTLPHAARTSAQTVDAVIAAGLAVWRKPDAHGAACANCHGPDGFELARFDFSDDDIRRQDAVHLSPQDSDKIVALMDDPERRRTMGELGRKRILEAFSWEHSAPPLLAAYERLFDKMGAKVR